MLTPEVTTIEALSDEHILEEFDCRRVPDMNEWLTEKALANHKNRQTRVFVLADSYRRVIGYYTLNGYCLEVSNLASRDGRSFQRFQSIPAHFLGRIALDAKHHGFGLGNLLMVSVMKTYARILDLSTSNFLCLDAKNEGLVKYYEGYGFKRSPVATDDGQPIPMYLKSSAILSFLEKHGLA